MSRSGYTDDGDQWGLIKWRGQVASAIRGKRGQAFLMELLDALEAMPEKRLIARELILDAPAFVPPSLSKKYVPQVCALGAIGIRRGVELSKLDPQDHDKLVDVFGIAHQLIREIEYENDEAGDYYGTQTPEQRWQHMYDWAMRHIRFIKAAEGSSQDRHIP